MHLGDGGGGQCATEAGKQRLHRLAKGADDLGARRAFRKWRQPVLQMFQRRRHFGADNIGPRRQHLPQLDIGGSQSFQRLGQSRTGIGAAGTECTGGRRQQEGGMQQAQQPHHSRQAECMAAMPPDRLRTFTCPRPASEIIWANFAWGGKRRMLSAR